MSSKLSTASRLTAVSRHRSSTPGSCVDVAVRLTPLDGFEPVGRHQEQVADDLLDPGL
jgi:hypothetical protein